MRFWLVLILLPMMYLAAMAGYALGGGGSFPQEQQMVQHELPKEESVFFNKEVIAAMVAGGLGFAGIMYANRRKG